MSQNTVEELFQSAMAEGTLSQAAFAALSVTDIGEQIQAGLGIDVDDVVANEVLLLAQMPDDSGSIGSIRQDPQDWRSPVVGPRLIREGHNLVLEALAHSRAKDGILVHTRYLNGHVLNPYVQIDAAVRLTEQNYRANLGTPLYDQAFILLGTVMAKTQEFVDNGVPVRTVTLIISDGADLHSTRHTAADCAKLVNDLLKTERHIVAAMGIDDGATDFRQVFQAMGIRDEWILTPGNTESEIRRAFQVVSQSAVRASQNAASFSQTALGGFGA